MTKLKYILLGAIFLVGSASAADQEREVVRREQPEYPPIAARMHLHGTVKLKIWINPDGTVRRLDYIGGHPLLAESALKAVKGWKYEPAARESTDTVALKF
ncbi:MAG: energy transducer TonB [Acidobacteriia bacterium]|nr:energy transducer TonB [Terriglobia bacterium]